MILKKVLILALTITATAIQVKSQNAALRKEVAYLTDSIGSRYPGSSGDLMARRHIATQFSRFGLECKEYPFDIIENLWCDGSLQIQKDTIIHDFIQDEDFYINERSAEGMVSSRFVVVGNSLPDSLLEEIRDRIVVSLPVNTRNYTSKILTTSDAIKAGALAMIYVNPAGKKINKVISKGNRNHHPLQIPVLRLEHDELSQFLPDSIKDISDCNIYSAPPSHLIRITTQRKERIIKASNVIGVKNGTDERYIIVGAHYDTLGPDSETGEQRVGANDNASGVAAMIALANILSKKKTHHKILFAAFGGEEKGALGSMDLVQNLVQKDIQIDEMINLDMVGKMEGHTLFYRQFNEPKTSPDDIRHKRIKLTEGKDSLSDHYDFVMNGIPASYFTTGEDQFIHTTSDTSGKLNYKGMAETVRFLARYIISIDKSLN